MNDSERMASLLGVPVSLALGDGKSYRFSPLTMGDYAELDRWVRSTPIRQVQTAVLGIDDPDLRAELVRAAYDEMRSMPDEKAKLLSRTVDAIWFMGWLSVKKCHPELSFEDFGRLVDPKNKEMVEGVVLAASGMADPTSAKVTATAGPSASSAT